MTRSLRFVNKMQAKYASRMKTSVATTFAMMAPTKKPSSRLKITPQKSHRCFRLKGRSTIDAGPIVFPGGVLIDKTIRRGFVTGILNFEYLRQQLAYDRVILVVMNAELPVFKTEQSVL